MLHHLELTARRLLRHKSVSLINILGLSIGIAACLLIFRYVWDETTFDNINLKLSLALKGISYNFTADIPEKKGGCQFFQFGP